jgi:UDP-N-acetylmuramoyl-tripeptide--D-alanyl-D-alanine ligase
MKITSQVTSSIYEFECSEDALKRISSLLKQGDMVLLKGSRGMRLERVMELKRQAKVSTL